MLLKELRYIIEIQECGSVSQAAERLYISQPALSKYVKSLEDSLDIKLFERVGRRLIPTDAGLKYLEAARSMMDTFTTMSNELKNSDNLIHGLLRVGTSNSRSPLLLSKSIPLFHFKYPNVEIQLYEESSYKLENKLAEGLIDLLISKGPVSSLSKFVAKPLFTEELLLSLPQGHPLAAQAKPNGNSRFPWLDISLLRDETFVLLKTGQYTRLLVDQLFAEYEYYPKKILTTTNIETAIRMSANGIGPTFVPSFFTVNRYCSDLALDFFSVGRKSGHLMSTFNIIYRQDCNLTRYMQSYIEILQDQFGDGGPNP